jgi:hypothetical protein
MFVFVTWCTGLLKAAAISCRSRRHLPTTAFLALAHEVSHARRTTGRDVLRAFDQTTVSVTSMLLRVALE